MPAIHQRNVDGILVIRKQSYLTVFAMPPFVTSQDGMQQVPGVRAHQDLLDGAGVGFQRSRPAARDAIPAAAAVSQRTLRRPPAPH